MPQKPPIINFEPIDFEPIDSPVTTSIPEQKQLSFWERINQPLTDAPSRFASSIADYLAPPPTSEVAPHPLASFGAGAIQGIGDLVSGFTSPVNLATGVLTGGSGLAVKRGLGTLANALKYGARGAGALMAGHGATNVLSPESTLAQRGFGLTELAGGVAGMKFKPAVKPQPQFTSKPPKTEGDIVFSTKAEMDAAKPISETPASQVDIEPISPDFFKHMKPEKSGVAPETPVKPSITKPSKLEQPPLKQTAIEGGYIDPYETQRKLPVGTKITVSPESLNKKKLSDAIKLGFRYDGINEKGRIMLTKARPSTTVELMNDPTVEAAAWQEVINLPRSLMASLDMSAPLRQGLGLIHRPEFWKSLPSMVKAWKSEDFYQQAMKTIYDDPMFKRIAMPDGKLRASFAEEAGVKFTNLNDITGREEQMLSNIAEKFPGVRRSNRAYTLFLNKLRADTFKQMVNDYKVYAGPEGQNNMMVAKEIAQFINTASGRGSLGKLEQSAPVLSSLLFSPRLIASRLGMMAKGTQAIFSPEVYMMSQPSVRREYLKSLFSIAATAGTFTQMMRFVGAKVETDPASADFGKPKIGNTRIDPYGGFQQYIVLAQRLMPQIDLSYLGLRGEIGGKMKSTTTNIEYDLANPEYGQSTRGDVLGRFIRSKSNPIINFGWGLLTGQKEISGKKMKFATANPFENAIAQRFIPMLVQDIYEMYQDEKTPLPAKAIAGTGTFFGMGSQTYSNK